MEIIHSLRKEHKFLFEQDLDLPTQLQAIGYILSDLSVEEERLIRLKIRCKQRKRKYGGTALQKRIWKLRSYKNLLEKFCMFFVEELQEQQRLYILCGSSEIAKYRYKASFQISLKDLFRIKGYDLLFKYGWYNKEINPTGVVKDHRVSVKYGFDNRISPDIIGHSVNCEFLLNIDNLIKSSKCSISLEQLMKEIQVRDNNPIVR